MKKSEFERFPKCWKRQLLCKSVLFHIYLHIFIISFKLRAKDNKLFNCGDTNSGFWHGNTMDGRELESHVLSPDMGLPWSRNSFLMTCCSSCPAAEFQVFLLDILPQTPLFSDKEREINIDQQTPAVRENKLLSISLERYLPILFSFNEGIRPFACASKAVMTICLWKSWT